jgi:MYXO-CTERM domain-containing protein
MRNASALGLASVAALSAVTLWSAHASAAPPGLYTTSSSNGTVYRITQGGDQSAVTPYATGLDYPTGICVGPGGNLYVAEVNSGEITVAFQGANLTGATPFATGLDAPAALSCTPTQILVAEYATGEITNATAGGNLAGATPFASGLANVVQLYRAGDGSLLASTEAPGRVFDVTAGGSFASIPSFVTGDANSTCGGMAELGPNRLVAATSDVRTFNGGGPLANLPVFATPVPATTLLNIGGRILAASAGSGYVYDITAGAPNNYASGLGDYMFGLAYVAGCGSGFVEESEACDDGNTVDGDGCSSICETEPPPTTTSTSATSGSGGGGTGGAGGAGVGGAGGAGGQDEISGSVDLNIVCTASNAGAGGSAGAGFAALGLLGLAVAARRRRL